MTCNQSSDILYLHLSRSIFHLTDLKVQKYKKKLRKGTNTTLKLNIALKGQAILAHILQPCFFQH